MIERAISLVKDGFKYLREQPQLLLTLALIIVIPVAFWYTAISFKDVGRANQDRLEKDRIGLMQDVFVSLVRHTVSDVELIQTEINLLARDNPDITIFRFAKEVDAEIVPLAALDSEAIGEADAEDVYRLGLTRPDESVIYEYFRGSERYYQSVRHVRIENESYFILTEFSRVNADKLIASREFRAYIALFFILLVVMVLVLRHVFIINYGYLYREAKQAIQTKDMFMNMIAHELRAPLTAIRGYASMLREDKAVDERVKHDARRIEDSSERLITIVNDLLDVARIQSGKLSITKETMDVSGVVSTALETLEATAKKKHIELKSEGASAQVVIIGDAKRLTQALTNLVSNAIKYTEKGIIEVALTQKADRIEIRVKDTGMGIDAEGQKQLFAPFFRVKDATVDQITGTGLGMWITKQLIELMGGSVGVESIKGIGTHVVVTLPSK